MAIDFLPKVEECCGDIPLEFAIFAILFYDILVLGASVFEIMYPLCQNYSRTEGFGLFMRIFSWILLVLAILRVVLLFVVVLGMAIESLDPSLCNFGYVCITFLFVLMTITYSVLYQVLLAKANYKCYSRLIESVVKKLPTPEGIEEGALDPHVKSHAWAPPLYLFFAVLEGALRTYFAIVINSFEAETGD